MRLGDQNKTCAPQKIVHCVWKNSINGFKVKEDLSFWNINGLEGVEKPW